MEHLRTFVETSRMALPALGGLGLSSNPLTAPISCQPWTPGRPDAWYDGGEIGRGGFGSVSKVIELRDGRLYAVKRFDEKAPTRPSGKKRRLDEIGWFEGIRNEVDNMKESPHVSVESS